MKNNILFVQKTLIVWQQDHFTSGLGGGEKDIVFEKPICPREFAACDGPLACLMNAGDTARWLATWMQPPTCVF